MRSYVLILIEDEDRFAAMSEADRNALLARYRAWTAELRAAGRLRSADAVGGPGRVLRREGDRVVETEYAERRGMATCWFVVHAESLEEATAIARGCPGLLQGETVVVREAG